MTTRDTSREAFEQLIASGAIKGNQERILKAVIGGPDRTSGEICAALGIDNVNAWRARFTELQARGLIVESGTRPCKITGRAALTWQYSGRTKPLDVKKGHSARARGIAREAYLAAGGTATAFSTWWEQRA